MKRREFIALGSSLVALRLLPARAQQTTVPVIGFLSSASAPQFGHLVAAFRSGLNEAGFVEGQNVKIEYRWAEGNYDQLPALVADLVNLPVAAVAATGGSAPVAKQVPATIPVVFITTDPVRSGLAASLARPGGNMTGVAMLAAAMEPKRLEIMQELMPAAARFAALLHPNSHLTPSQTTDLLDASHHLGRPIEILLARSEHDLETAFARLSKTGSSALLVASDPFFNSRREHIVNLAARYSVPAVYEWREFVEVGGLISYGPSIADAYRQAGISMGHVLHGAKPADMPVLQPTKFELVVNLKAAAALGLTIPTSLLARADEVIE